MTLRVLVFPCGSEIGLEAHAALRYCKDVELYGASSVPDHGEFLYARYAQIQARTDDPDFLDALRALIAQWKIDAVLPAHDSVIPLLAAATALGALVIAPDAPTAAICRDKQLTYDALEPLGIVPHRVPFPATAYPIFAKPAIGQGSQGAIRVDDIATHERLLCSGQRLVFAEYLPGEEYTVDCISGGDGVLLHAAPRLRLRVKSGIAVRTVPAPSDPAIAHIAERIAGVLHLRGAWFFQLRRDAAGIPKLLEVAPRIAGSMGLSRNRGINYPLLSLYAHLGKPFQILPQYHGLELDRALVSRYRNALRYRHVYLDLDDTLIVRGQPNVLLMALLYQWTAREIGVTLLTRHRHCPHQTLDRHRISQTLFAQIVQIGEQDRKSAHIAPGMQAIFIDDSYRERCDVAQVHGIPVLDVDAIEQLFDWRA